MALFGEDYLKHAHFINPGEFLYMKGKIQTRWKRDDDFEFKVQSIQLLPDVRSKVCKKVSVSIDLSVVDANMVDKIENLATTYAGACNLEIVLVDSKEQVALKMFSHKFKVTPSNELINELAAMNGIEYKISA
jgi:DNA polymerase-3 subunit alpha